MVSGPRKDKLVLQCVLFQNCDNRSGTNKTPDGESRLQVKWLRKCEKKKMWWITRMGCFHDVIDAERSYHVIAFSAVLTPIRRIGCNLSHFKMLSSETSEHDPLSKATANSKPQRGRVVSRAIMAT